MTEKMHGPLAPNVNLTHPRQDWGWQLGDCVYGEKGKVFRYVRFRDDVTYQTGDVVTRASADEWEVTNERSGGSALSGLQVIGVVFQGDDDLPEQDDFGWVQISGVAPVRGSFSAGDQLIPHASNDGQAASRAADSGTTANNNVFAYAVDSERADLRGLK